MQNLLVDAFSVRLKDLLEHGKSIGSAVLELQIPIADAYLGVAQVVELECTKNPAELFDRPPG